MYPVAVLRNSSAMVGIATVTIVTSSAARKRAEARERRMRVVWRGVRVDSGVGAADGEVVEGGSWGDGGWASLAAVPVVMAVVVMVSGRGGSASGGMVLAEDEFELFALPVVVMLGAEGSASFSGPRPAPGAGAGAAAAAAAAMIDYPLVPFRWKTWGGFLD